MTKIMNMTEQEYREAPGLNYSLLADFADSPDKALMEREPKSYFEVGKIFETLFQDEIQGTNRFSETYFVADLSGTIPEKIVKWLDEGSDLESCYVYNKDGVTKSKTYKNVHAWLDACLEFPGKRPVSQDMMAQAKAMVANMCKVELFGIPLVTILRSAQFQVPIFWQSNGIQKKALLDIVADVEMEGVKSKMVFDLKSSADLPKFKSMMRSRYFWQDAHYLEGAYHNFGSVYPNMIFLAASKAEPWIAQPFEMAEDSRNHVQNKYDHLCEEFQKWDATGRPKKGWKPMEEIKIYI